MPDTLLIGSIKWIGVILIGIITLYLIKKFCDIGNSM